MSMFFVDGKSRIRYKQRDQKDEYLILKYFICITLSLGVKVKLTLDTNYMLNDFYREIMRQSSVSGLGLNKIGPII